MASNEVEKSSRMQKILNGIERVGNKVPHPSIIFLVLMGIIIALSHVFYLLGSSATFESMNVDTHTVEEVTVTVQSLLSADGIRFLFTSTVSNFMSFTALGVTLVAMVGVGLAEEVGLIGALIHKLVKIVPKKALTAIIVFIGVLSSIASDAGYLVLIPLGAAVFYKMGRHPIAGLAAAFAGVAGGFGVNFLITPIDGMLTEIINEAIHIIDPSRSIDLTANLYFNIASTILIVIVCTIVNEKLVEPRLGTYKSDVDILPEESSSEDEAKGLRYALFGLIGIAALIALLTLPSGAPLRDPVTGDIVGTTPFMNSLITIIMLVFLIPSICFGLGTGKVKSSADVVNPIVKVFGNLSGMIFLLLVISQFIAYFNFTNLGTVLAVNAADFIEGLNMSGLALLISFIVLMGVLDIILVGAIPKFAILTPIFVPLFMQLGIAPEAVLAAYRIGDSPMNVVTPLLPYFALIVTFAERYVKKSGVGTIIALMLPHTVALFIAWTLLLVVFYIFGIPLGPGSTIYLN